MHHPMILKNIVRETGLENHLKLVEAFDNGLLTD